MNLSAVFHRASDNYCYILDNDTLVINLYTGYDIQECFLCYDDPFSGGIMGKNTGWRGKREQIVTKKYLKNHILWTHMVKPEYKRCKYFFELYSDNESIYFMEDGFHKENDLKNAERILQYFFFPWMNSADINIVPSWVNDTVWYQIFPERFCNGNPLLNPENVKEWASPDKKVTNEEFYGGDIEGIISKLDYLKNLGIGGIYLTPINESTTSHKYNTTDYYKIDKHFGNKETMKKLVFEAHKRGIRIMLDGVFNHCGMDFPQWRDVIKNGEKSQYFDWFMINHYPFEKPSDKNARNKNYYTFAFSDYMPKFNTNNPAVRNFIIDVCLYWVKEYDIDAIRLDVANEFSHLLANEMRTALKNIKPDFYILGEVWHDSIEWLRGDQFDSVMNYTLEQSIVTFFDDESISAKDFEFEINRCISLYMQQTKDVLFNLLDSHDTIRLISRTKNIGKFYQQMVVLFTMPGTACIYYGTEVRLEGGYDPDCRRCMPWNEIENGSYDDRINILKQIISIRKNYECARKGEIEFIRSEKYDRLVTYKRSFHGEQIEVILNCTKEKIKVEEFKNTIFSFNQKENELLPDGVIIVKI